MQDCTLLFKGLPKNSDFIWAKKCLWNFNFTLELMENRIEHHFTPLYCCKPASRLIISPKAKTPVNMSRLDSISSNLYCLQWFVARYQLSITTIVLTGKKGGRLALIIKSIAEVSAKLIDGVVLVGDTTCLLCTTWWLPRPLLVAKKRGQDLHWKVCSWVDEAMMTLSTVFIWLKVLFILHIN